MYSTESRQLNRAARSSPRGAYFFSPCIARANPPFLGYSFQSREQKSDMLFLYKDATGKPYKKAGKIDYVNAWYFKAAEYMQGTNIKSAFVSTNSITQGEQIAGAWLPLYDRFGIHIDFAYRTFKWGNEATDQAAVHVVIIGFSTAPNYKEKKIFNQDESVIIANNISPYLIDAPLIFIESRNKPLCNIPEMVTGNRPADGGALIIKQEEYDEFIKKDPKSKKYIKILYGAEEFINNKKRYCLWLVNVPPAEIKQMPEVYKRIALCKENRLNGAADRQKLADKPAIFRETLNPKTAVVIPEVSSERRRYIPMGYINEDIICTNKLKLIPEASLYEFGILISNIHMSWTRTVCGRMKSDYNYSKDIVYNNFPWPKPTEQQRQKIEFTAKAILDVREQHSESSLADLYDPLLMPPDLKKAHQANDRAVMEAYGMWNKVESESECVAWLFRMYQELTK